MKKTKIFFFEHHPLMLLGIGALIEKEEDFVFLGSSNRSDHFLEEMGKHRPDAVVLDVTFFTDTGFCLIENLKQKHPDTCVIVLSVHRERNYVQKVIETGASGYVLKTDDPRHIITAIRTGLNGEIFISGQVHTGKEKTVNTDSPINKLSRLEFEILQGVGKGLTSNVIARECDMELSAVDDRIEKIQKKLDLRTQSELLQYAVHWVHHEGGFL